MFVHDFYVPIVIFQPEPVLWKFALSFNPTSFHFLILIVVFISS